MGTGICLILLGFAYLFTGKMGFGSLGLGLTNNKMGMGSTSVHEKTYISRSIDLDDIPQVS